MTDTFDTDALHSGVAEAQSIVDVATRAAEPQSLDLGDGRFYSIVSPSGEVKIVDLEAERRKVEDQDAPRHKRGTYRVHDADSFVTYLNKHGDDHTEVWADNPAAKITAVLNAHQGLVGDTAADGTRPRFEDHRVEYSVLLTDAWKAWTEHDGKLISQSDFAEHIEDRAIDIIEPSGADMLELAQTFQATIGVNFESSKRLSSGERQLEYREKIDAQAAPPAEATGPRHARRGPVRNQLHTKGTTTDEHYHLRTQRRLHRGRRRPGRGVVRRRRRQRPRALRRPRRPDHLHPERHLADHARRRTAHHRRADPGTRGQRRQLLRPSDRRRPDLGRVRDGGREVSTAIRVSVAPIGVEGPPEIRMSGSIPVVEWKSESWAEVFLLLGNHNDPATYLRDTAERLQALADLVDAHAARTAEQAVSC